MCSLRVLGVGFLANFSKSRISKNIMRNVVSNIMKLPQAPMILEELQQAWADEQARRQQFYEKMDEEQKTEFIQGEVIVHSPVKKPHLNAAGNIYTLLNLFVKRHQLGEVFTEKALIQLTRNDFEPDVCFFKCMKLYKAESQAASQHPSP